MKKFSNEHFRPGVLAFYPAHVVAAYFFGVDICHGIKLPNKNRGDLTVCSTGRIVHFYIDDNIESDQQQIYFNHLTFVE
jgi:hypothetical protein